MSEGFSNEEYTREFARDCREILEDIIGQKSLVEEQLSNGERADQSLIDGMAASFRAVEGSADFLGLEPVYRITARLAERLAQAEEPDPALLGEVGRGIDCLLALSDQLAETGRLDAEEPSSIAFLAEIEPEPVAKRTALPERRAEPDPEPGAMPSFEIEITPEMLQAFVTEAEEYLEMTETSLLLLEKNLEDRESLDHAFRGLHTFKGNCGLFNYPALEKLGHQLEEILESYKSGAKPVERQGISLILKVLDVLGTAVHALPEGGGEVPGFDELMTLLVEYQTHGRVERHFTGGGDATLIGEILVEMGVLERLTLERSLAAQSKPLGEILVERGAITRESLIKALEVQRSRREAGGGQTRRKRSAQNIRVDLLKLDALMNLVGELIIAENAVANNPDLDGLELPNFRKSSLQLERITRELQDIAMSLRMIPIENTFQKMVRLVRDVSQKQGKAVELEMRGADTEVDKSVVESLANPLLHIIRNAVDHGIESVDERETAGKPPTGTVRLTAYHQGGEVVIEVRDDGRGIDPGMILAKARQKGLLDTDQDLETEQEIYDLIFEPGFSTAAEVTDISGRGVGMDVVKRSIESVKGRITVTSRTGEGTCFSIRIPLTLAIIDGMLVRVGGQLFTVPLLSIRESIRTRPEWVTRTIDGGELIDIRGELVPVVRLHRILETPGEHEALTRGILLVVEQDDRRLCLFADEILGQYQTVIKGLGDFFGKIRGVSGSSILSNGDISLILDIKGLSDLFLDPSRDREQIAHIIAHKE